jgi:lipopolysaccharide transport system permease protein
MSKWLLVWWAVFRRDLKAQYRRSMLGPVWALVQPLTYLLVFTFVHGILNIASDDLPYPLFLYAGLVPFSYLTNATLRGAGAIAANGNVIKKMHVPCEAFIVAAMTNATVDAAVSLLLLLGLMAWFGIMPGLLVLFWLPVLVTVLALLALGLALLLAALGTFKNDLFVVAPILFQLWLIASPVIYPPSAVPAEWASLYALNPMVGVVDGFRSVLLHGHAPEMQSLAVSIAFALVAAGLGFTAFRNLSKHFADVLA